MNCMSVNEAKNLICPILSKYGAIGNCRAKECISWQSKDKEDSYCVIMKFFKG